MSHVTPYLTVNDSKAAIEFYKAAFLAEHIGPTINGPDGSIAHTEIKIGESVVMMADANKEWGNMSPLDIGGTAVLLSIELDDVDATVERAEAAGASILMPVADQFYGHRSGRIKDPFGHVWVLTTVIEEVSEEEMQRRADAMFGSPE
jgi:PhnB protein